MAEAGPVLVMARSDCATTVTDCVAELLPLFGSAVVAETVAVSTAGPLAGADIESVSVGAEPALAIEVAVEQVAVLPASDPHVHPVPEKVNDVTPDGKVFVTVTVPLVASGPLLLTTIANDSGLLALTGLLDAVLVIDRSAAA